MRKQRDEEVEEEERAGGVGEGQEEEEEEDDDDDDDVELDDEDCFFESLDRVPSRISFDLDIPSSGSDDEDDVRVSFASAVAPSSFRRISLSDDDNDENDRGGGGGGKEGGYDYGIWMAEPISIKERRRRLLQGMGLTSSKDLHVGSKSRKILSSRSRLSSSRFAAAAPASTATPITVDEPTPSPQPSPPVFTRSRSDTHLATVRVPAAGGSSSPYPILIRASSTPPSLWDRLGSHGRRWTMMSRDGFGGGEGDGLGADTLPPGLCKIKNLDTGKEFVVSEFGKDGTWGRLNDLQTGLQLTMEEFERCLGHSPIVKEVMRRANLGAGNKKRNGSSASTTATANNHWAFSFKTTSSKSSSGRKKGGWLKNIKFVASSVTGRISEKEKDYGSSASIAGKSSGGSTSGSERMKVYQHGKSHKELTGLYMCQEIQAHQGSIWTIKFSSDSRYLASAGEDRVVNVWQVLECDTLSSSLHRQDQPHSPSHQPPLANGSSLDRGAQPSKRTRKSKVSSASSRSSVPDYIVMPETIFSLSDKPVCSFQGHLDDVLDLSWSKSQYLLSSSMDKTVRLWDMETKACLKLFAHNDYVTCIQFNPVDDRYFISGSLDAKVRIWSIPDRQVVDWNDLHEMVTAACYTPDGQGALVGSHKGSCRFYNTSDSKLYQEGQIDIRNKKKKSHAKKITGFQFAPDNPSEVLITSADSQIRVFDGVDMIHKFRGFRNTSSQIAASFTLDGKYVVCASEDSHVYVWKRDAGRNSSAGGKSKGWITTRSNEHFYCKDVSVAIPWPCGGSNCEPAPSLPSWSRRHNDHAASNLEDMFPSSRSHHCPPLPRKSFSEHTLPCPEELRIPSRSGSGFGSSASLRSAAGAVPSISASATSSSSSSSSWGRYSGGGSSNRITSSLEAANAWGLVVVTAGLGGNIRIYQNFGLPLRLSRPTNLF